MNTKTGSAIAKGQEESCNGSAEGGTSFAQQEEKRVRTMIDMLIKILKATKDKNMKAMILQVYIAKYGPVPNEYGDIIKDLLRGDSE